ncbi:MAG: histidine kinase dimerization/phospho-acceptor domain-containing protein [Verrucomicrobiales bacterium]
MSSRSLRKQLTTALIGSFTVLGVAGNLAVYQYVKHLDLEEFDGDLKEEMHNLVDLTVIGPDGTIEVEMHRFNLPQYRPTAGNPRYYQVWNDFKNDAVLVKSRSLETGDLPRPEVKLGELHISDLTLPDGRRGRMISTVREVVPGLSAGSLSGSSDRVDRKYSVQFSLAKSREDVDAILKLELLFSTAIGALMTVGGLLLTVWLTRRVVSHVDRLADGMEAVDLDSLSSRIPEVDFPLELKPCASQFNALLDRLEKGVEREKRFRIDVAHELRTPLTALLSMHELAVEEIADGSLEDPGAYSSEALLLTQRLHRLIETLSSIHRAGTGREIVQMENIQLAPLIEATWAEHAATAGRRKIEMALGGPGLAICSDRVISQAVLGNLFSNAISYSPDNGVIHCNVSVEGSGVAIEVTNQVYVSLDQNDVSSLTEPFWQKDPSRTDPEHIGLGLSLVAAYCELIGWRQKFTISDSKVFTARIGVPRR